MYIGVKFENYFRSKSKFYMVRNRNSKAKFNILWT